MGLLIQDRLFLDTYKSVVNLRNELKGVVTAFDVIRQAYLSEFPPILYKEEFMKGG